MIGLALYLLLIYLTAGACASLIYHRMLAHQAVKLQPWFEKLMVMLALPAGTPVQWVGTHRQQHLYTDKAGDPHSPALYGFWYAHCGWYIKTDNSFLCLLYSLGGPLRLLFDSYWRPRNRLEYNHLAKDISNNSFYNWVSQPLHYMLILWIYCMVLLIPAWLLGGATGILSVWIVLVVIYNLGDSLNSVGHSFGERLSNKNKSSNNKLLAFFTFGEGFHSDHHHSPNTLNANTHHDFNISQLVIKCWELCGLIKNRRSDSSTLI